MSRRYAESAHESIHGRLLNWGNRARGGLPACETTDFDPTDPRPTVDELDA